VLATASFEVTLPAVTLDAAASVAPSAPFTVAWTGPQRKGDYIDLVKRGQTATSGELNYFYAVKDTNSSLTAPAQGGAYEIRYVLEGPGGRVVLGRRAITVQ
jgi:Ca-activated chloride channel family protein